MSKLGGRKWLAAIITIISYVLQASFLPSLDADGIFAVCLVFIVAEGTIDVTRVAVAVVQSWRSGQVVNEELLSGSTDTELGDV